MARKKPKIPLQNIAVLSFWDPQVFIENLGICINILCF